MQNTNDWMEFFSSLVKGLLRITTVFIDYTVYMTPGHLCIYCHKVAMCSSEEIPTV